LVYGLHYLIHNFLNSNGFFLELPLSKKLPYPYTCITHLLPLRKPVFLNDIPCLIPLVYPRLYTPCLIWSAKSSSVSTNFSIFSFISQASLSKSSPIFTISVHFSRQYAIGLNTISYFVTPPASKASKISP